MIVNGQSCMSRKYMFMSQEMTSEKDAYGVEKQ